MNTELRKNVKIDFEKNFFKLMNNAEKSRTKKNSDDLLTIEIKRTQILTNKPVYLGLSILQIDEMTLDKIIL